MKLYTAQGKKFKIPEYQANDFLNEARAGGIAVEEYLPYEAPDKKYLIPASKATEFEQDAKANNVPVKRVENLAIRERYQRVLEGQKLAQTQLPNNALGKVVAIAENAKEAIKKPAGFAMEALTRSPITTIAAGPINAAIQTAVQKISNPKPQEFPPSSKEADIIRKRTFVDEVTAPIKRLAGNLKLIDASIQSGVFGAAEQVARAAKTISGSTGERTSMSGSVLDSVQAAKEKYGGSLESLGDAKNLPVQKAVSQGVESAVTSGALAAQAALAGTMVGGPAGTVAGYVAGGGVIQGLAEYDRSFDDFVRIKGTTDGAHEYAQKQAAIQGGGEAVQNLIEAATFKLGKPASVVAKRGFLQFAGQLLRAALPEIATETGQQYASAKQAEQAGLIETAPTLKETVKEVAAPTAIATALQGGGINLSRIGERSQPIKSFEELSNVVAEQQTSSAEPATIRPQEQGRAPMLDNKLAEVQPTFTETKKAEQELAGQSVGPGAASVLDPAFKEKIPTSIKNAVVDEERIKRGLPPAAEAARKEFGQSWDNALARMDANPKAQDDLIFELTQKPRPVNDEENAMLLAKQIELQSEYDGAAYSLEEAEKSGDTVAAKDHQVRLNRLSEELLNLYNVSKSAGTEQGRGLVTRRMLADENYTLANMMTRARIDNGGEKLAPKQEAEVKQLHAQISEADKRLKTFKKRTQSRIADYERRTASGEFEKTPKPELKYDAEALDLNFKLEKAKQKFNEKLFEYRLAKRSFPKKIFGNIGDSLNTARAVVTSADFSAVLRQGGFISFAHPIRSVKALPDMFRAFASEKAQFRVDNEIKNRPNAPLYRRAKLYLADQTGGLTKMEEAYASRWASKIPGVGASQRAYVTFLNRLRADSFDAMVAGLGKDGEATLDEAKAIANFINVATGRGSFGSTEQAAVGLNVAFFAPRYVASRFQLIAGQPFYRGDAKTRKLIAKEYARYLTGIGVIYGLAQLAGADTEWDWRSSDFGKIRVDNTLIDPLSGLSQSTVFTGRTITGKTRRPSGEIVPIRGTNIPYGGDDWSDVAKRFLRTKLSPSFAVATDVLTGTDLVGKPTTTGSVIKKALVPISFQDVYDAIKEQGVSAGVALGLLAAFGASVMTYQENAPTERRQ